MLAFIEDVQMQSIQLPVEQADEIWTRIFPTYHLNTNLGPVATDGVVKPLTRSAVRINAVYHSLDGTGQVFRESTARRSLNYKNSISQVQHDPLYTLVNDGANPTALRFDLPAGYTANSLWTAADVYCHYIPVPIDPETQGTEDTLDFEPMYWNSIINRAARFAGADTQDPETMQMIAGAN